MATRQLVEDALTNVFLAKDASAVPHYFSEGLVQHHPNFTNGLEPIRRLVSSLHEMEVLRVIASGPLAVAHVRVTGWCDRPLMMFNVFRVRDGRIVEHWDVLQPSEAEPWISELPTGSDEATPVSRGAVRGLFDRVLYPACYDRLTDYVALGRYQRYHPGVERALRFGEGLAVQYAATYRLVAEGNFAFTHSEGEVEGRRVAAGELFRVEHGQIVEHWDCIQPVPQTAANANGMFRQLTE